MKSAVIFFAFCCISATGCAQDWAPFVKGDVSYYKQELETSLRVESFKPDQLSLLGNENILYFNRKNELDPDCYNVLLKEISNWDWLLNPEKIDSLVFRNDSMLFFSNLSGETDTVIFKPYVKPGESWITNGVTIECSGFGIKEFIGISDSVKYFICSGNDFDTKEFILSKSHGFIKFPPLSEFLLDHTGRDFSPDFELLGYQDDLGSDGYNPPGFSDYFHLQPGDKLYWSIEYWDYFTEPIYVKTYAVDSILSAMITGDAVSYELNTRYYKENGQLDRTTTRSNEFTYSEEGRMLESPTSWFVLRYTDYQPFDVYYLKSLYLEIEGEDTVSISEYVLDGLQFDTTSCSPDIIMDYGHTKKYSTRVGISSVESFTEGGSLTQIMGSVVNGVSHGTTYIPVGTTLIPTPSLKIYPNPFTDIIQIETDGPVPAKIEIHDIQGRIVYSEEFSTRPDLGQLAPGIYILDVIQIDGKRESFKVVKE